MSADNPTYEELPVETDWKLSKDKINRLQQASMERLVKRCKGAHFVDIQVKLRINGGWETYEADWLKHLSPSGGDR